MRRSRQMSESIELGIVLALAGGFMDAYSYMCRDEVFANAQTGNMLLLGINLSEGNWGMALRYLFPVLAFAVGIALADVVRVHAKDKSLFHWRQLSVLCEALVLFVVCFFPQSMNLAANSLTSHPDSLDTVLANVSSALLRLISCIITSYLCLNMPV